MRCTCAGVRAGMVLCRVHVVAGVMSCVGVWCVALWWCTCGARGAMRYVGVRCGVWCDAVCGVIVFGVMRYVGVVARCAVVVCVVMRCDAYGVIV